MNTRTRIERVPVAGGPGESGDGDERAGGFETVIVIDKGTHELIMPREGETEEVVGVIIREKVRGD